MVRRVRRVELRHCGKFDQNPSNHGRDMAAIFGWNAHDTKLRCRAIFGRNWSKRSRDMAIFSIFQVGGCRHLGFLKIEIFDGRTAQKGPTVLVCQIWWKSVKPQLGYGDFSIFKYSGRRHLGFLNF